MIAVFLPENVKDAMRSDRRHFLYIVALPDMLKFVLFTQYIY